MMPLFHLELVDHNLIVLIRKIQAYALSELKVYLYQIFMDSIDKTVSYFLVKIWKFPP